MNVAICTCADQVPTQSVSEVMEHTVSVFLQYNIFEKQNHSMLTKATFINTVKTVIQFKITFLFSSYFET